VERLLGTERDFGNRKTSEAEGQIHIMKSHFADEERLRRHGKTILRFADGFGKASVSPTPFPFNSQGS
jgi:hypothetical protein